MGVSVNVSAADLIVAEGGQGGAYASLNDAYSAAVNGDRILVYPKANGVAYAENLTIGKDVDISSAENGVKFGYQGTITINGAAIPVNSEIILSGMLVQSGNIVSSGAPASGQLNVRIVNCKLNAGYIDLRANYLSTYMAGDSIMNGYVNISYGHILGSYIENTSYNASTVYIANYATLTGDSLYIAGNTIKTPNIVSSIYGIYFENTYNYAQIYNNVVQIRNVSGYQMGLYINGTDNLAGRTTIHNNVIYNSGGSAYGIYLFGPYPNYGSNSYFDIHNNIIATTGSYAIYSYYNSVLVEASYNFINTGITPFTNVANNGTNTIANMVSFLNTTTWEQNPGSPAINGGDPDEAYTDLDLSRNDAGVFGGSFSHENFYNGGAAAVGLVLAPRRVLSGQTISIEASGFDR